MSCAVVDTNVLLVANGKHPDVSPQCVLECIDRLEQLRKVGVVVIDDGYRILSEYQYKTSPNSSQGGGNQFLKWLLRNQANTCRVHRVPLTETADDEFAEFPDPVLQSQFDPPDRKFAAVAHAHPDKPLVWQAADCKWLGWWVALEKQGVKVEFFCPDDVIRFFKQKFPKQAVPPLPDV